MSSVEILIGLVLAVLVVFSTTANMAIRNHSRVGLSDRLEKRGRIELLSLLTDHRNELLFVTSLIRTAAILGLFLLVARFFGIQPHFEHAPAYQYFAIFMTLMIIIMTLGMAIPNSWARHGGDAFLAESLTTVLALRKVFWPLAALYHVLDVLFQRLAGVPMSNGAQDEADQIEREILGVVSEGERAGAVTEEDADMIESVMEFRDTEVKEIMTPRTDIVALPETATLAEVKDLIGREGHSRIPVYGENIDDIKGVLYAKDLLKLNEGDSFSAVAMLRKVPFVPEAKQISDLLTELREKKVHLAIVLDEYGGTAGLVTIEDIIEEIVGEIEDEYESPEPDPILRIDAYTIEVDARVHIDEINEELNIQLPEDQEYDTVGGFVFSTMGKIPAAGEEMEYGNVLLRVIDAEERKINRLRVEVRPTENNE